MEVTVHNCEECHNLIPEITSAFVDKLRLLRYRHNLVLIYELHLTGDYIKAARTMHKSHYREEYCDHTTNIQTDHWWIDDQPYDQGYSFEGENFATVEQGLAKITKRYKSVAANLVCIYVDDSSGDLN